MITLVPYDDSNGLIDYGGGAITIGPADALTRLRGPNPSIVQSQPVEVAADGTSLWVSCRTDPFGVSACCRCVHYPCVTPSAPGSPPANWQPMTLSPMNTYSPVSITTPAGDKIFVIAATDMNSVTTALEGLVGTSGGLGFHVYVVQASAGSSPSGLDLSSPKVLAIPVSSWAFPNPQAPSAP